MTGEVILGQNLYLLDALEGTVEQVIRQLPLRGPDGTYLVGDEELRTTTLTATSGAKAFWRLACAARAEIVRRITERTSDSTVIAREIAREAAEQHTSVRTLRRDAAIGEVYGPLFAAPDGAPDLDRSYYTIALSCPDPAAALALAAQRKDENPLYSTRDFESDLARARIAAPQVGYGADYAGRAALAYIWPYWEGGVLGVAEKAMTLPLGRWLLPDAVVLVRTPPRALDLCVRLLAAHNVLYHTTIFVPLPPYRDGCAWQECELILYGTTGKLRPTDSLPGIWRDGVQDCIARYFPFASPKLAVYPRRGMHVSEGWMTPEGLPDGVR